MGSARRLPSRTWIERQNWCMKQSAAGVKTQIELNALAWFLATSPESRLRDPQQAVKLAKRAVEIHPNDGENWNTLGIAHYRDGNWNAALDALQKSMDLRNGGSSVDWFIVAMAHCQKGSDDVSRTWFDKAVRWMETNRPGNKELGRFRAEAAGLLAAKEKKN